LSPCLSAVPYCYTLIYRANQVILYGRVIVSLHYHKFSSITVEGCATQISDREYHVDSKLIRPYNIVRLMIIIILRHIFWVTNTSILDLVSTFKLLASTMKCGAAQIIIIIRQHLNTEIINPAHPLKRDQ